MTLNTRAGIFLLGLAVGLLAWHSGLWPTACVELVATAEAVVGAPRTPVSYAGVARRTTVGVGAPGVGVAPANRGGPVNRVGVR